MKLTEARRVSGASARSMREAIGNPLTAAILLEQETRREARKALHRERYERRYARHASAPRQQKRAQPTVRKAPLPGRSMSGFVRAMKIVTARLFGNPVGKVENRGRYPSATKAGPGRRRAIGKAHPAGSKLVKRFVRDARGENVQYRRLHQQMTGKEQV